MRVCLVFAVVLVCACGKKPPAIIDARLPDATMTDGMVVDAPEDAPPGIDAALGHPGTGTVSGAVHATSPNYKLFGTLRSGDGSSSSPSYQRHGGVTGATQR